MRARVAKPRNRVEIGKSKGIEHMYRAGGRRKGCGMKWCVTKGCGQMGAGRNGDTDKMERYNRAPFSRKRTKWCGIKWYCMNCVLLAT